MKYSVPFTLIGLAQAAIQHISNGVEYTISVHKDGEEVDFNWGPEFKLGSRGPVPVDDSSKSASRRTTQADVQNTGNWCGMAHTNHPSGTWKNVYGGWVVPSISLRDGQSNTDQPSIAQWVGIDGDGCGSGLIQGGTVSQIMNDGSQKNYAWWEFVPDYLHSIELEVNLGDSIYGNVTATSETSGIVEVINITTGLALSVTINNGPGTLCGYSAEWILEDLSGGGGLLPFAEFPDSAFFGPIATTTTGTVVNAENADVVNLWANGQELCTASWDGSVSNINVDSLA